MHATLAIVVGWVAVLVLDTVGALASKRFAFPYSRLCVVSWSIYITLGYLVGTGNGLLAAAYTTFAVSLVDASVGWRIAWLIGPGRPPVDHIPVSRIVFACAYVVCIATALGAWGGYLAHFMAQNT
ncbi:MAG TPA: hypothetical protein VJR92_01145 [Gemmatimonadaceae bacterium]|nr:hypothetical protein [Gemmatimonadaceae bacterium]